MYDLYFAFYGVFAETGNMHQHLNLKFSDVCQVLEDTFPFLS